MKNFEKYCDELVASKGDICDFMEKCVYKVKCLSCTWSCQQCREKLFTWLNEEYKPQIDWSKVPVDTPVIVKERSGTERKRHFCRYEKDHYEPFVCFNSGYTSFTGGTTTSWDNCELAREEDIEKYSI